MPDNEDDEVLSQSEINDLLNDIGGGDESPAQGDVDADAASESPSPQIKIYDFLRPDFLSEDDVSVMHAIGHRLESSLSRLVEGFRLTSFDLLSRDEYGRTLGTPCFLLPFCYDSRRALYFETSHTASRALVNVALGLTFPGGASVSGGSAEEPLTTVELAALAAALGTWLREAATWDGITPTCGAAITDPTLLRRGTIGESLGVFAFELDAEGKRGMASAAIDRFTIQTLFLADRRTTIGESANPDLVLREVLRFPLPGTTGADLRAAIEKGRVSTTHAGIGEIDYREE